ncbi:bifunctional 2-polyprenyl-6-hydroxyphenol methylase/3-demethylubiquinol 3-O-methyltransferase UbiG [Inmirania thermothiophila]|uniref:Ubiquinone biosynthesis O-methyltransferase n=1 Tax=Inmirania thermothiophila TaxID=1750597 RepID=A0A3N1Y0F1_9GAMM|nr:bifunctional 2-polyprenyl-6-hydroxyphenol methylase/3-demethylubiquinol 3-O-methyltransferase UbiG [Inmirania thermothiophila]ROR32286.1 3-demethylubiquinone-9 3-methyltransferase [Inmirania thermothiophila]
MSTPNLDPAEIARFDGFAARWWDPDGEMRALHAMNPVRLAYIDRHCALAGRRVLDVGCGGGILAEAMAGLGAEVTGIDASAEALAVARSHAVATGVQVRYEEATAEAWAETHAGSYAAVTCMELLEHVPDPAGLVAACARLAAPGGWVFFSTINRTWMARALAIGAAEHLLGLVPRGTHRHDRFVRPSELAAWGRAAGLDAVDVTGVVFDPLAWRFREAACVEVNYMAAFRREAAA